MGRLQRPKVFKMDVTISTTRQDVGAYTIEHLPTGSQYHGSTGNLYRRVIEHQKDLRNECHGNAGLQQLFKEDPSFSLTFYPSSTREEATQKEQDLIDQTPCEKRLNISLNAASPISGLLANPAIRPAILEKKLGNKNAAGYQHTPEWKADKSKQMKGNNHLLGHVHSEETKQAMRLAHLGRKRSEAEIAASAEGRTRDRVVVDGVTYQNAAAAARELGLSVSGVKKRCHSDKFPNYRLVPK